MVRQEHGLVMNNSRVSHLQLWIQASFALSRAVPFFMMDVQQLGQTEAYLLDIEEHFKKQYKRMNNGEPINHDVDAMLMNRLVGFSKYWVFGLYELLRTLREVTTQPQQKKSFHPPYDVFESLFWDIEILRMPLAKYEVAKINGIQHWPSLRFYPDYGCCGWEVFCKKSNGLRVISRVELSNGFLSAVQQLKDNPQ